ncbi:MULTISPECIES: ABC transporter ATP-binding protein [unclassified Fusibacter]|uniref:ABC transporter ATP-binding protein n=1 Tax=unclassified Fusibacter TaxID=2624464 RepID=UPI00101063A0|nr:MULTISPECIES: ABC transporter ATP-binding protein [unclassified Fusibacter]MCK8060721.1 ABC transporter ATP-binding protein [Fusibacter sp. A2]NPE23016.1 ABC transporter ATP-binding protein [Fusibacter sp. A1]RXV59688.1 ABC transporter ATP-binding protein [Fusibacter sp. A1]
MTIVKLENLTKYYGKNKGIENVSFEIGEGEVFGFIGPNGAGKSTTIRTLLGFIKPTSGSATILGRDISLNLNDAKMNLGYLPSEVAYYDDMNALQLLRYSGKFYKKNFDARIHELAAYFELDLKRKIEDLSYGNRKKVGIIQSLLHSPRLLILDEPTGGLDPLIQSRFFDLLDKERKNGTTIFFSSHILSEVQRMCDRIGIIKEGELIKVEKLADMQKVRYKKIGIELDRLPEITIFDNISTKELSIKGNRVDFLYSGEMHDLLQGISKIGVKNLWVEDPNLEEIFMHYYQ